jgi:hypothetical protein
LETHGKRMHSDARLLFLRYALLRIFAASSEAHIDDESCSF